MYSLWYSFGEYEYEYEYSLLSDLTDEYGTRIYSDGTRWRYRWQK
jgi:hypothetical protein